MKIAKTLASRLRRNEPAERARRVNFLLKVSRGFSYLEVGVWKGETFLSARARYRVGVDPDPLLPQASMPPGAFVFKQTSDVFFETYFGPSFDVVFIDGLHKSEVALRDFINSVDNLRPGGWLLIDDVVPPNQSLADDGPYGDIWRLAALLHGNLISWNLFFIGDGESEHCQLALQKPANFDGLPFSEEEGVRAMVEMDFFAEVEVVLRAKLMAESAAFSLIMAGVNQRSGDLR
jgi:SAM-dependent methyltransferase